MGHIVRTALADVRWALRRPHLYWAAGAALVAVLFLDDSGDLAVVRGLLGTIVLLMGAAMSAIVKRAIERGNERAAQVTAERIHCACLNLMADALVEATQPSDDDPQSGTCDTAALRVVHQ